MMKKFTVKITYSNSEPVTVEAESLEEVDSIIKDIISKRIRYSVQELENEEDDPILFDEDLLWEEGSDGEVSEGDKLMTVGWEE